MVDLKNEIRRISTARQLVRVGGVCDLCGDEEKNHIHENVIVLHFIQKSGEINKVVLCNLHEGVLLQRLTKSYLKRMSCKPKKRDQKMGFMGSVPKDFPGEDEGILSIIEQKKKEVLNG